MWTNNSLDDIITGVMRFGPDILEKCLADPKLVNSYLDRIDQEKLNYPKTKKDINIKQWNIPENYCSNLIDDLYNLCETDEQRARVDLELELFIKNNMLEVLYVMKYIVDTLRTNSVVWGVGRGSSVSSYVLFLIGIHKIDSIKYNLPIEEFFKGE